MATRTLVPSYLFRQLLETLSVVSQLVRICYYLNACPLVFHPQSSHALFASLGTSPFGGPSHHRDGRVFCARFVLRVLRLYRIYGVRGVPLRQLPA